MTIKRSIATMAVLLLATGCTLITDFDDPGDLYSLQENMSGQVTVTIGSGGTGTFTLSLLEELPEGDDAELLALLEDDTIQLEVINDETTVSYNLTQGTRVDSTPTGAGQYMLSLSEDRLVLTVTFYNDYNGHSLSSGGDYSASITVLQNDYFAAESFTIDAITVN